jgi:uncharacterized repeat protein (TIGR03843 family)
LRVIGRLVGSSNNALLVAVGDGDAATVAVYKPIAGERPLFDFPDGTLAHREVAAFLVSESTGWGVVPATVLRDGPYGIGMVQRWIEADPAADVVTMVVGDDPRLRPIALFDAVVNNADRKGGHLLPMPDGHVFGVDHGVTFSLEPKLRTVLWGWEGEPIEPAERRVLERLRHRLDGNLGAALAAHLTADEIAATRARLDDLLAAGVFPSPSPTWPALPWPLF